MWVRTLKFIKTGGKVTHGVQSVFSLFRCTWEGWPYLRLGAVVQHWSHMCPEEELTLVFFCSCLRVSS